jgi:hypothetical protein
MNERTSISLNPHAVVEHIDSTPGDCLEARSCLLIGRQRDLSGSLKAIDYALSDGNVHVVSICMTSSFIAKRWR